VIGREMLFLVMVNLFFFLIEKTNKNWVEGNSWEYWMGNKLGRRRQVVDERYTRPQGLYVHKDVDHKKLRKLILESKLAPCFPGDEDSCNDHEECPICFLVCISITIFVSLSFFPSSLLWFCFAQFHCV